MWRVVVLGCFLIGCDEVFDLERIAGCPVPVVGMAQADDDQDLLPNAEDNCPSTSNPDQHDEDGDLIGDQCDLCPIGSEMRDADCDGIGASCDLDDTRDHVRLFHGFGSSNGLDLSTGLNRATIGGDALQIRYATHTMDSFFGWGMVTTPVAFEGVYETQFTWTKADNYFSVQMRYGVSETSPRMGYIVELIGAGDDRIGIRSYVGPATEPIIETPITNVPPGTYTLRAHVAAGRTRAVLVGDNNFAAETEAATPAAAAEGLLELRAHFVDIDFAYVSHVGAAR